MKRSFFGITIAGVLISIIVIFVISDSSNLTSEKTKSVYHVTLADPSLFTEGIFSDSFFVQKGDYEFRFIPNGDSPKSLSISLSGSSFLFNGDFELEGTSHEPGISVYYTWDYLGKKQIKIQESQDIQIKIDPHGTVNGPVSISLINP